MNSNLLFDFSVDKENKRIYVKREFAAERDLVWAAWTTPELLDQWWAPKPYKTQTKSMDFKVGGTWLYAMMSPEGMTHWSRSDYQTIDATNSYSTLNAFCDENGNINTDFRRSLWNNSFSGQGDTTTVNVVIQYEEVSDL